jgi:prolipoprotein diacylglyceryltransferase
MLVLAAAATMAPWVHATGRLRCLVQGCCHGRPIARAEFGIRVHEPHSRVCKLDDMTDVPIHPTQLYSILGSIVVGLLLARMWSLHAALPFIVGLHFVLMGLLRFTEETYRGEPQTPRSYGMAVYHWMAIASVLAGIGVSCFRGAAAPAPVWPPSAPVLAAALAAGFIFWAAMGVDLPQSQRRFARLSG